jgi:hypothetical protein
MKKPAAKRRRFLFSLPQRVNLYEYKKDNGEKINFTLEKENSYYLFLNSDENVQLIKESLKTYLQERREIVSLIDSKFTKSRNITNDIRDVLNAFNK